ncbi:MAG: UDP-galactopyranose mutase [Candidatus Levybacteria bacterium]|nr:UDP-galactopyranose mutase [Candidatus Levybacteria bacterium]
MGKIVIVGAGLSGAVLAERYADKLGKDVLVIEKRNHVAGNCYDYYNEHGLLVAKYGAHIFHTSYEDVWKYVNRFSKWRSYKHKVLCRVDDKLVPVPVNIVTVNKLFNLKLANEEEMGAWLNDNTEKIDNPKNSKEVALSRVGKELYEKMFKNYTKKQWDKWPSELEASVLERIPVRMNFNYRYFNDKYEGIPVDGYTRLVENMLDNPRITVKLSTNYFKIKSSIGDFEKMFYTGPIDRFFDHKYDKLEYRSLRFEFETYNQEYFQKSAVINYPSSNVLYTRIVEYKRLYNQKHTKTTISKEYSIADGEPFYPVPNNKNKNIFNKYKKEAKKMKDIFFVGRLANYRYFNMDQAIKNAFDLFRNIEEK